MTAQDVMRARAAHKLAADQSYEAKQERAMAVVNRILAPRISALKYVGPAQPQMSDLHRSFCRRSITDMAVGRCRFCHPDPEVFKCPACDFEVYERWQMWVHNKVNPKWCRDRAERKARRWAEHA